MKYYDKHHEAIDTQVWGFFERDRMKRDRIEEIWLDCWSAYYSTPESAQYDRQRAWYTEGDSRNDWRHHLKVGKAFDAVETIIAYMMSASFPNNDWMAVDLLDITEDNYTLARVIKRLLMFYFDAGKFPTHYEIFLRQLIITGVSCLKLVYELDDDDELQVRFEPKDMFSIYYDPFVAYEHTPIIERQLMPKSAVVGKIDSGDWSWDHTEIPLSPQHAQDERQRLSDFTLSGYPETAVETVEVWEYWGEVDCGGEYRNLHVTYINRTCVACEFYTHRPYILGSYIDAHYQLFPIGAIQPALGLLHELNSITNQRLDGLEITSNPMYTLTADSLMETDDLSVVPGKVWEVTDHGALQPVMLGNINTTSYSESQYLDGNIDKIFATGAYISPGQGRSGERVTAYEVQAVRDAGGNKLAARHAHIERTALTEMLLALFNLLRDSLQLEKMLKLPSPTKSGVFEFFVISPEELKSVAHLRIRPMGSNHVIERQRYIEDRLSFLQAVGQIPQAQELLDYKALILDLLQRWGFEEPERYMKQDEPAPEAPDAGAPPELKLEDTAAFKQMMSSQLAADGGASLFSNSQLAQPYDAQQPADPTTAGIAANFAAGANPGSGLGSASGGGIPPA